MSGLLDLVREKNDPKLTKELEDLIRKADGQGLTNPLFSDSWSSLAKKPEATSNSQGYRGYLKNLKEKLGISDFTGDTIVFRTNAEVMGRLFPDELKQGDTIHIFHRSGTFHYDARFQEGVNSNWGDVGSNTVTGYSLASLQDILFDLLRKAFGESVQTIIVANLIHRLMSTEGEGLTKLKLAGGIYHSHLWLRKSIVNSWSFRKELRQNALENVCRALCGKSFPFEELEKATAFINCYEMDTLYYGASLIERDLL